MKVGHLGLARWLLVAAALAGSTVASQAQQCRLCARAVVINSSLATCFLQDYDMLSADGDPTVVVDLSDCGGSRGVVEALPTPHLREEPTDTRFMLTRAQLSCLKQRIQEPDLVLDPSVRIELEDCTAGDQ